MVYLEDRRWQWFFNSINGCYNQLDHNGKLIPDSIASPYEMAELCLDAMGETGYVIDLPTQLDSSYRNITGIANFTFLPTGINFPLTGSNPAMDWVCQNPAQALQQLCDQFQRRIVFQCIQDRVIIAQVGQGKTLPRGPSYSIEKRSIALKTPETCDSVGVQGDPTFYQDRFLLEPVALEYDGTYVPVNNVSYAPRGSTGKAQITEIEIQEPTIPIDHSAVFHLYLCNLQGDPERDGLNADSGGITYLTVGAQTGAQVATAFGAVIAAYPGVAALCSVTVSGNKIILTAPGLGQGFNTATKVDGNTVPGEAIFDIITQVAVDPKEPWANCPWPTFSTVQATDRLTFNQAVAHAQASVWKAYRLATVGLDGSSSLKVNGYDGQINSRQQIVLSDRQVDQITPQAASPGQQGIPQQSIVTVTVPVSGTEEGTVFALSVARAGRLNAQNFIFQYRSDIPGHSSTDVCNSLANQVNLSGLPIKATVVVVTAGQVTKIELDGADDQVSFNLATSMAGPPTVGARITTQLTQPNVPKQVGFLTTGLLDTQYIADTYRGLSKDKPSRVYGSVATASLLQDRSIVYVGDDTSDATGNTSPYLLVPVPFRTDPIHQVIIFDNYVHLSRGKEGYGFPVLALQVAVNVRDPDTNQLVAFQRIQPIPPAVTPTLTKMVLKQDVQLNVTTAYAEIGDTFPNTVTPLPPNYLKSISLLEVDPIFRADYYIQQLLTEIQLTAGEVIHYNGIIPIECDGAVQQVTWKGDTVSGCMTMASYNCEHHPLVEPYPRRRRHESLAAIEEQVQRNQRVNQFRQTIGE
jgi:hypothetical protein